MTDTTDAIDIAKTAEQTATKAVGEMNNKVAQAVQSSWTLNIFGVQLWEFVILFAISILIYNIFFHKFCYNLLKHKYQGNISKFRVVIYYCLVGVFLSICTFNIAYYSEPHIETLINIFMMFFMWTLTKYLQKFLDKYFVRWSQKKFGKRAVTHNGVKSIIKGLILMLALVFTFIVLRIGIMNFLDIPIPKYLVAFVIVPFLLKVNFLSYFSVISTGFIIGDFIQIGLDSDAVMGTCISVSLSGVILETRNGEHISLPLSYVANMVVINKSTMRSYPSDMTYRFRLHNNEYGDTVRVLKEYQQKIANIIKTHPDCKLIQCGYDIGVRYYHTLHVVYDVKTDTLADARNVMNDIYYKIIAACESGLVNYNSEERC